MRNGFGAGNGGSERRAAIAREDRQAASRIEQARRDVQSGKVTAEQAYARLNNR